MDISEKLADELTLDEAREYVETQFGHIPEWPTHAGMMTYPRMFEELVKSGTGTGCAIRMLEQFHQVYNEWNGAPQ